MIMQWLYSLCNFITVTYLFHSTPAGGVSQSDGQFVYRMNHKKRGLFVLINNKSFQPQTKMTER